ncbi:restriction endonuclease subunit S [Pseudomonas sp. D2-30]|uniref:restriction endonuclease subunit S n=1 Tax=unclassified Pseudomonas TaxID=196821 RepID=UPI003DA7CB14
MSDWNVIPIKQLGRVVTGKTPPTASQEYYGGDELFVSPKDLTRDSCFVSETETKITASALEKFKGQVIPQNSVMFTSLSFAFGKMGITIQPCITNQQINTVVPNEEHNYRFVYYLLRTYEPIIFSYNSGIDTPIVPKSVFENIKVRRPKLELQKKIAAALSTYDDLIDNNRRRIGLLAQAAEELYREWFVRFRFPGYQQTRFEKGIPSTWKMKKFGEFCGLKRGYDLPDAQIEDGDFPIIASTSIKAYHNQFKVEPPVICTGRSGSLGTVLFVNERAWPLNTALYVQKFYGNSPYLIYFTLKNMGLASFNSGAGVPSLNRNHLNGISIAVPDKPLQQAFDKHVSVLFNQKDKLVEACSSLQKSRNALLTRLISGKLSVDQLDIHFPPSMREVDATQQEIAHA